MRIDKRITNFVKTQAAPASQKKKENASKGGPSDLLKAASFEALPEGILRKILGHLPYQDLANCDVVNKACRAVGQQVWEKHAGMRLPCHVPQGSGAIKRSVLQQAQTLQGFPEDEVDDPVALIRLIDCKSQRGRVARYGLLARLDEKQWLEPKHLEMILSMCRSSNRIDETVDWLKRLMTKWPHAVESVCLTLIENGYNDALLRAGLSPGIKSQAVADALARRNEVGLVLATIPLDVNLYQLCRSATQAGAVETVEKLLKIDHELIKAIADELEENVWLSAEERRRFFLILIEAGAAGSIRWRVFANDCDSALQWAEAIHSLGTDLNKRDGIGSTFLSEANDPDLYAFLLNHGADPCVANVDGVTTLHRLAQNPSCSKFLKRVIESGIDINSIDSNGRTPLHLANNTSFIVAAVARGGNLLRRDFNGVTALGQLLRQENQSLGLAAALLVLADGKDRQEITSRMSVPRGRNVGAVALHLLIGPERHIASSLMESISRLPNEDFDLLVELAAHRGCCFRRTNHCGQTLAHFMAAKNSSVEALYILQKTDAPIDQEDFVGYTPLVYAAAKGHVNFCAALLQAGADPERMTQGSIKRALARADERSKNQQQQSQARYMNRDIQEPASLDSDFSDSELRDIKPTVRQARSLNNRKIGGDKVTVATLFSSREKNERAEHDILFDIIRRSERFFSRNGLFVTTGQD